MDNKTDTNTVFKRATEIGKVLDNFVNVWHSKPSAVRLMIADNAALKIAEKYFELLKTTIKGVYLPETGFANKYKIASGTEIACMFAMPISLDDPNFTYKDKRFVNSLFGIELAIQMLLLINSDNGEQISPESLYKEELISLTENHRIWLAHLNLKSLFSVPTLLNSTFWEAYFIILSR